MTIEEKAREIVRTAIDNSLSVDKTTKAILDLIKPMSKERLIDIIVDFMRINKDPDKGFTGELKSVGWSDINNLAEAILAEWGKE